MMFKINKYNLRLFSIILVITLIFSTNFPKNIKNIYNNKFEERLTNIYGFCNGESIGYLRYLKNKFKFEDNPKIINYIHTPNVEWSIFLPGEYKKKSKYIILLNYPGEKVLIRGSDKYLNELVIDNLSFYSDKVDKIDKLLISLNTVNKEKNYNIQLFSELVNGKRNLIKEFKKFEINNNELKFELNIDLNKINEFNDNISIRLINFKEDNVKQLKLFSKNKFILKNYELIDNSKNCYLLKSND